MSETIRAKAATKPPWTGHVDAIGTVPLAARAATKCAYCGLENFDPYEACPKNNPGEEQKP